MEEEGAGEGVGEDGREEGGRRQGEGEAGGGEFGDVIVRRWLRGLFPKQTEIWERYFSMSTEGLGKPYI